MRARTFDVGLLCGICLLVSCNSGAQPGLRMPGLNPDGAGRDALTEYDANQNGFIDAKELEKCPPLKQALASVDRDGDGKVSAKEISDRLRFYQERKLAIVDIECQVMVDTSGLAGAMVTFAPETWMGPEVKTAKGMTDQNGSVSLQAEGESLPGLNCGFYRVSVSKKDVQGKETLAPRFNAQTTLGFEIAPDMREASFLLKVARK